MLITPIIFLVIGYSLMYVIGQPVIQFATSSLNMLLLSDVPTFAATEEPATFADVQETSEVAATQNSGETEIASSSVTYPIGGELYGEVVIDSLGVDEPLYYGDTNEILRLGAGQYMGSVYPGEVGTSLIGGHNTDTFGRLIGVSIGDLISINTTYANYQYQVTQMDIRNKDDEEIKQLLNQRDTPMVILYSCYPVNSVGLTDDRVFVVCQLVSGPIINADA